MSVRYRLSTGPGSWTQPFSGVLDVGVPTAVDRGAEFAVLYPLTGSFTVAGVTFNLNGGMVVHDIGAGLWDANFAVPFTASNGLSHHWESADGTFFRADGSPYPSASGASSIAYVVYPETIHYLHSSFGNGAALGHGTLIAQRLCAPAALDDAHLKDLETKITDLSNALATLGRGTDLRELLMIIRNPGWTTPAELALVLSLLDSMQAQTKLLTDTSARLLAGSKLVATAT